MLIVALRFLPLVGVLFGAASVAGAPFSQTGVDEFYDLAWREIIHSDRALAKPKLDAIGAADLRSLSGDYSFDHADDGMARLTIQSTRWKLKLGNGVESGRWALIGDKILLIYGDDELRGFILRIHAHWHFMDLDLPHGVAPLRKE